MAHTSSAPLAAEVSSHGRTTLSDQEQQILQFERQWWRYAGAKEQAIRDQFSLNATRYYQILNRLLDDPAAMEFDPLLVKRLRRLRESRQRARTSRSAARR